VVHNRVRRRGSVALAITGLLAGPTAVVGLTSAPASAAEVTINLLAINDFHGRMNLSSSGDNTVKFAGTVAQLETPGNTMIVGAGDMIGATEFESGIQDDNPTIDVLNAIGLDASAVGNHEFDKGFADLKGRVQDRANWEYLGANVYNKGTTTPALAEYYVQDIGGVSVGVIGAVTEETPSLVNPNGIADIQFGNAVAAVQRVANQLSDGNAANGEADVVVATFHAGATTGTGDQPPSTYEAEIAKGGEFAQMASLNSNVDVILNGHTHKVYAWDAPKPGGGTRPILQTGEYGKNVGQVQLKVESTTGAITSYTAQNVKRTTTADATLVSTYPSVATVKGIVDAALAYAKPIGEQPAGTITADITRAYTGTSEDRGGESSLGDLVANALRDGMPANFPKPDFGVTNPGGLRQDLLYKGDTAAGGPNNVDGGVTYKEVVNVLPFANDTSIVDLKGSAIKEILEQQWQPAGSSRPFLHLGLSDNVDVTLDAAQPAGSRVTSVRINGVPLDLNKTYKVGTFTFLAFGGDNFTSFKKGTQSVTGRLDRDLFRAYLQARPATSPNFDREQVYVTGLPDSLIAGQKVDVAFDKLDMGSVGAPANTGVRVLKVKNGKEKQVKWLPVTAGKASGSFRVRGAADYKLVAVPSGTTLSRDVVRSRPKLKVKVFPKRLAAGKSAIRLKAKLRPDVDGIAPRGMSPVAGKVTVRIGKHTWKKWAKDGDATLRLGRIAAGKYKAVVRYHGTSQYKGARKVVTLRVR
jgi:2',3'-cyclic-nucleotide 2'-phosphodiesterase (5'-nucleotidase family)